MGNEIRYSIRSDSILSLSVFGGFDMQKSAQLGLRVLICVIGIVSGCRGGGGERVLVDPFSQTQSASVSPRKSQIEIAESLFRDGCKLDRNKDAGCVAQ